MLTNVVMLLVANLRNSIVGLGDWLLTTGISLLLVICLISTAQPKGHRSKGVGVHIRKITLSFDTTNRTRGMGGRGRT